MADNSNYRITARVNGKEQKTFNFGEETLRIDAAADTVYEIEEIGFSSIPDNIVFSRVGNDLWIMPEGNATPQAILAGYFSTKNASFGAIGVDGALYSYGIETLSEPAINAAKAASVEHTLAEELTTSAAPAANTAESSASSTSLVDNINVPVVSTAALALGGIAIATGTGGSSHNSANENSQPTEDKSATNSANDTVSASANTSPTDGIIVAGGGTRPIEQPIQINENVATPLGASSYDPQPEPQAYVIQGQQAFSHSHASSNHAPELQLSSFTKLEAGKAQAGMVVFQVNANDQDGDFLTYHLTDNGAGSYEIDIRSGAVTLTTTGAAKINSGETLPVAKVVAYDGIEDSKEIALNYADPSQTDVAPIVNDVPIIAATLISPIDHIDQGSAQEGMLVGQLNATDANGDALSYYLVENPQGAYSVELHTGKVSLTAAGAALVNAGLDLPNIRALAYDGKGASAVSDINVVETTENVTNHAPTNPVLVGQQDIVIGQAQAGDSIATLSANDQDGDTIHYYLVNNPHNAYALDGVTGVVTLTEQGAKWVNDGNNLPKLQVVAYDQQDFSSIVTLDAPQPKDAPVIPENHAPNAPTFSETAQNFTQGEVEAGVIVTKAQATDPDAGDTVTYSLGNQDGFFTIDAQSGVVTLTVKGAEYVNSGQSLPDVTVIASDGKLTSQASVDIGDTKAAPAPINHAPSAPTFSETAQSFTQGEVEAGTIVTKAHSTDPDVGDTVTYSLIDNAHGFFAIDKESGIVTLTAKGAQQVNDGQSLPDVTVAATDGKLVSNTRLSVGETEVVTSAPVNHAPNAPTFSETAQSFTQGEVEAGTIVTKAKATDPDAGDTVTYSLGNQDGFFAIDAQSGVVTLTVKGAEYVNSGQSLPDVTVIASDGKLTSQASVDVGETEMEDLAPVNHAPNAPVFSDVTSQFIQGHVQAGDHVLTAKATDADNDTIEYRLTDADDNVFFNINAETGQVTLSELGAKHVNDGHTLPAVEVVAFDGKVTGESAFALTGHTEIPAVEVPALPTPADLPMPTFSADTQFHDSRELQNVERPYFIKALNVDYPYGYLGNWDGYGQGMTVSYQFADSAHASGGSGYSRYDFTVGGFREYSAEQKTAIREALSIYEEYSNLTFEEKSASDQANFRFYLDDLNNSKTYRYNHFESSADITVTDNTAQAFSGNGICPCCGLPLNALAEQASESNNFTFVSGYAWFGGDVHLNSTVYTSDDSLSKDTSFFNNGSITYQGGFGALLHEIGHSIGFHHIFAEEKAPSEIPQGSAEDQSTLSIMSYTPIYSGGRAISATKLGIFDLAALHYRYGVNPNQNSGDDTYTFKSFNQDSVGNDIYIWDGAGNDTFDASGETKALHINLTPGSWIYRGKKADTLVFDENRNVVKDQMFIGFGTQIENLKGGYSHDVLIGNETNNHIEGGAGNDQISGGAGNDWLEGGEGSDILQGGDGDDILDGGLGADSLQGGAGNDIYYVDNEDDQVIDESGIDTVYSSISYTLGAGLENLHLYKGAGNINATGNELDNVLWGNEGDNILKGGAGNDELHGGAGNDTLVGGSGADIFFIDGAGLDTIADFNANEGDIIKLDKSVFEQLKTGVFNPEIFVSNDSGTAQDANDHFIYNTTNNTLYYDADGNGALGAVAIAKFADNFNDQLSASNFQVY